MDKFSHPYYGCSLEEKAACKKILDKTGLKGAQVIKTSLSVSKHVFFMLYGLYAKVATYI